MKELNKFRQFLTESKEETNEIFGLLGDKAQTRKAAKALDALEKALFELNFLDILGPEDYEGWMLKYEELRGRVMAGLEDEDRKKYDVAYGSSEGDLDENDKALDEILSENFQKLLNEEYSPEQQRAFENFKTSIMNILEARSNLYAAANNMKYEKMSYNDIAKSMTSEFQSMFGIDPQALKYFGKYADDYPLTSEKGKMLVSMFKEGVEKNTIQTMVRWAETYSKKIPKQTDNRIGGALVEIKKLLDDGIQTATKFKEVFKGLDENDSVLDEIINEAKPNLKKALPTIAARNVERNNLINADIEDMMDMVGGAGKGEGSEEAQILFKASNASAELENALTDLQMYFEDDLGEGKESLNEEYSPEQQKAFKSLVYKAGQPMINYAHRLSVRNNMGAPTLTWEQGVERGRKGGWFKDFWPDNLIKILASKPDLNSKGGEALKIFFDQHADDIKNDAERSAKIFGNPQNKPDATEKLLVQDYEALAKAAEVYKQTFKA